MTGDKSRRLGFTQVVTGDEFLKPVASRILKADVCDSNIKKQEHLKNAFIVRK